MTLEDIDYYRNRALEERALADRSEMPEAARAHAELASYYERLVARAAAAPAGPTSATGGGGR